MRFTVRARNNDSSAICGDIMRAPGFREPPVHEHPLKKLSTMAGHSLQTLIFFFFFFWGGGGGGGAGVMDT